MGKFKATLLIGSILIHLLVPHQMLLQLLVIVGAAVDDGIKHFEQRVHVIALAGMSHGATHA